MPPVRSYSPPSPLVNTQVDEDENAMLTQALEPEQEPELCSCPFPHTHCAAKRARVVLPVETDVIDGTCSSLGDRRNLPESTSPGEGLLELGDGVLQICPGQKLGTMLTTQEVEHTVALLPLQVKERDHRGPISITERCCMIHLTFSGRTGEHAILMASLAGQRPVQTGSLGVLRVEPQASGPWCALRAITRW